MSLESVSVGAEAGKKEIKDVCVNYKEVILPTKLPAVELHCGKCRHQVLTKKKSVWNNNASGFAAILKPRILKMCISSLTFACDHSRISLIIWLNISVIDSEVFLYMTVTFIL